MRQVNGLRLNRFDLREHFPQAGSQSRAVEWNETVPQECGAQRSTLYWVAAGKIIASVKRFSFLSPLHHYHSIFPIIAAWQMQSLCWISRRKPCFHYGKPCV